MQESHEFLPRGPNFPGIEISDADMSDKTRWMTLLVAASIGRLYLDPDFVLSPMGTLEPIQGRRTSEMKKTTKKTSKQLGKAVGDLFVFVCLG